MHDTLKTSTRRPVAILALGAALIAGLLTMASTGIGMAKPSKLPIQEDEPGFNCATMGNKVCSALSDGKPATGKKLDEMRANAKLSAQALNTPTQTCDVTGPQYWSDGAYGFKATCTAKVTTTTHKVPVPVPVKPRITG